MLGLFLLGMISRRASNPAAAAGVVLGILVICWMVLSPYLTGRWAVLRSPFHAFLIPVLGTLVILLTGLLLSRFTASRESAASTSIDGRDMAEGRAS